VQYLNTSREHSDELIEKALPAWISKWGKTATLADWKTRAGPFGWSADSRDWATRDFHEHIGAIDATPAQPARKTRARG